MQCSAVQGCITVTVIISKPTNDFMVKKLNKYISLLVV